MRIAIALLSAFIAGPIIAQDHVARSPAGDTVRITDKPCTNAAILPLLQMLPQRWREAYAVVDGKRWPACWLEMNGHAILKYEDNDNGLIPMGEFKPDMGSV